VQDYQHSTAPNRRYPDLIAQRLLKAAANDEPRPYGDEELLAFAAHCMQREDAARKVGRTMRRIAAAIMLSSHTGQTFDAIVTGASDKAPSCACCGRLPRDGWCATSKTSTSATRAMSG
jgi:exoribonuclease R